VEATSALFMRASTTDRGITGAKPCLSHEEWERAHEEWERVHEKSASRMKSPLTA
jgi:hypothetical protein